MYSSDKRRRRDHRERSRCQPSQSPVVTEWPQLRQTFETGLQGPAAPDHNEPREATRLGFSFSTMNTDTIGVCRTLSCRRLLGMILAKSVAPAVPSCMSDQAESRESGARPFALEKCSQVNSQTLLRSSGEDLSLLPELNV